MGGEHVGRLGGGHEVDQRFTRDEDHTGHGRARYMRDNRRMVTLR
jgi:hypothetical protein